MDCIDTPDATLTVGKDEIIHIKIKNIFMGVDTSIAISNAILKLRPDC